MWFYATSRYFTNEYYLAGRFYPADVTRPSSASNDTSQQAYGGTYTYDNNGRVTWAIIDKQKISGWYAYQYKVDPHWLIQIVQRVAGGGAHHDVAHAALDDEVDLHRDEPSAVRGGHQWPARARTRSCSIPIRSAACPVRDHWRRAASPS